VERRRFPKPIWLPEEGPVGFPDPRLFAPEGLIAGGGALSVEWLLAAYGLGIFPWFNEPPILWWSPDPRAIVTPDSLHISRSLRRALRKTSFTVTMTREIRPVMSACGDRKEGTWVTNEMLDAYEALGRAGHSLAFEVCDDGELVGGLYGVLTGRLFAAESKFHRKTDASKIGLVTAVHYLFSRGVELFDVQFQTDHLASLGVVEVPRGDYVLAAHGASRREGPALLETGVDLIPWLRAELEKGTSPPETGETP
jgi:leucyl/phenylalanyl-tRNA---protein transferase